MCKMFKLHRKPPNWAFYDRLFLLAAVSRSQNNTINIFFASFPWKSVKVTWNISYTQNILGICNLTKYFWFLTVPTIKSLSKSYYLLSGIDEISTVFFLSRPIAPLWDYWDLLKWAQFYLVRLQKQGSIWPLLKNSLHC